MAYGAQSKAKTAARGWTFVPFDCSFSKELIDGGLGKRAFVDRAGAAARSSRASCMAIVE